MDLKKLAVIMNPPYQISDGGCIDGFSAQPLYHKFIETSIDCISVDYLVSINPSRWMVGGKGLNKFRKRMMSDKSVKYIKHYDRSTDIFPSVEVSGGVNYFLWDFNYNGACEFSDMESTMSRYLDEFDVVITDNISLGIVNTVTNGHSDFINSKCLPRKPFGLRTNFRGWSETGVEYFAANKVIHLVSELSYTDKHSVKDKYKSCISKMASDIACRVGNRGRTLLNKSFTAKPGTICTETYLVVNSFDTELESENFVKYMRTRFFRFMLGVQVTTQNISRDKFSFVPDLKDYTRSYTDEDLYEMFNLTEEQQAYIESKIKPL